MRDDYRRSMRLSIVATAAIAAIVLTVTGCATAPAEEGSLGGQDAQPAKLIAVPGTSLHKVVLTPAAVAQVGIKTTPVEAIPTSTPTPASTATPAATSTAAAGTASEIPVTAVIYDPQGASWTYTIPAERTYLRVPIVVERVDGNIAYLSSGPPVGTPVVSQGAPELLGAEYGVGEE